MSTIITPTQDTWWIGRAQGMQPEEIVYSFNAAGLMFGCGQPIFEEYFNEKDWLKRLAQLGVTLTGKQLANSWLFIYNNYGFLINIFTNRKNRVISFGNLDENSSITLDSQNILEIYNTEDELESAVDTFVNEPGYYKEQAESGTSEVCLGESVKYPVIIPNEEK